MKKFMIILAKSHKSCLNVNANEHKKPHVIRRNVTNEKHGKDADRKEINSELNWPLFKRGVLLEGFLARFW